MQVQEYSTNFPEEVKTRGVSSLLYLNSRDASYDIKDKTYTFPKVIIKNLKTIRLVYFNIPYGWYTITETLNSFSFHVSSGRIFREMKKKPITGTPYRNIFG